MKKRKRHIFNATGMALCVAMLTLASCTHTHIRSDAQPKIENSKLPGYFDVVRGESYQGFIVPKSHYEEHRLGFMQRDTVRRFNPSVYEIAHAEKYIKELFLEMQQAVHHRFQHSLSEYWREYIGIYRNRDGRRGEKLIVIKLNLGSMPRISNEVSRSSTNPCEDYFEIEYDIDTDTARISYFDCMVQNYW